MIETNNENNDGYVIEPESALNVYKLKCLLGIDIYNSYDNYSINPNGTCSIDWENEVNDKLFIEIGKNTMTYQVYENDVFSYGQDYKLINQAESDVISTIIKKIKNI